MQLEIRAQSIETVQADAVVVGVFSDGIMTPSAAYAEAACEGAITEMIAEGDFDLERFDNRAILLCVIALVIGADQNFHVSCVVLRQSAVCDNASAVYGNARRANVKSFSRSFIKLEKGYGIARLVRLKIKRAVFKINVL